MNSYWWLPIALAGIAIVLIGIATWLKERQRQRKGDST